MAAYRFRLVKGRKPFFCNLLHLEAKDVEVPRNYHGDEAQSISNSELTTFLLKDLNLELMFRDALRFLLKVKEHSLHRLSKSTVKTKCVSKGFFTECEYASLNKGDWFV